MNAIKEYEAQKWKIIGQKVGKPPKVGPHALALASRPRADGTLGM